MTLVLSLYRGLIDLAPPPPTARTMRQIAEEVAWRHGLSLEKLRDYSDRQKLAPPRQEAMWLMYETGRFSNRQIGLFFSGRDHTTVITGRHAHAERIARQAIAEAA